MTDYRDDTPFDASKTHSVEEIAKAIRTKKYGIDTREAMAQSLEKMADIAKENRAGQVIATPSGVFDTLGELQTKYPSGMEGVFLVVENGHKYIYTNGSWQDSGVYQAAGIPKKSIPVRGKAYLPNSQKISYEIKGGGILKITLPVDQIVIIGDEPRFLEKVDLTEVENTSSAVVTSNSIEGNDFILLYDTLENVLKIRANNNFSRPTELMLAYNKYGSNIGGLLLNNAFEKDFLKINLNYSSVLESQNIDAYFNGGFTISFDKKSDGVYTTKIPKKDLNFVGSVNKTIESQKLIDFLKKQTLILNFIEEEDYISFDGTNFMLAYDFKDNNFVMYRNNTYLYAWQIPLLVVYYNSYFGGLFYNNYKKSLIKKDVPEIPSYYVEHLNSKIFDINSTIAQAGTDALTFAMIADTHWDSNDKHSPALLKEILKRTPTPYLIHLGDLINESKNKAYCFNQLQETRALLDPYKYGMPVLFGNHDDNSNWSSQDLINSNKLMKEQVIAALVSNGGENRLNQRLVNSEDLAFTLDFSKNSPYQDLGTSWRGFAFDSGSAAGDFYRVDRDFQKFVEFCKEPGNIVVFTHVISDNAHVPEKIQELGKLIDAVNQKAQVTLSEGTFDCTGCQAHVVCAFAGHDHKDQLFSTPAGTPLIVVDCDAGKLTWQNTEHPYVKGTITEQSFNVVTIRPRDKKIILNRIGRGDNREISYI